jgi:hypothetical protein
MTRTCISDERLADYLEGRLSSTERGQIEDHLSFCEHCLDTVQIYQRLVPEHFGRPEIVPPTAVKQALCRLDRLDSGSLMDALSGRIRSLILKWKEYVNAKGMGGHAVLEPIRGSKTLVANDLVVLNKTFSDLETEISIEKIDPRLAIVSVTISKVNPEKTPVRVSLMTEQREVASYLVGSGDAYFERVPFGHYTLRFTSNGALIGQYAFQLKETDDDSHEATR